GIFHLRNTYGALFAQDSMRLGSRTTFNFGARWDIMQPWYERNNQLQTIVPGQRSSVFPGASLGLVVPGDLGVARVLSSTTTGDFAPRVGVALAPCEQF